MRWKSTLVLLVVTVGLGVYVSQVDLKQPTVEEREQIAKEVVTVDEDAVTSIQVSGPSGSFALAKDGGVWRLTSPTAARADATQLRRLLYYLDPVESERSLKGSQDKPLALAEFGLEPPKATLTVAEGARTVTLLFGDKTPIGDSRYLKLQDKPEVYVASNRLFSAIDQAWDAYRSKALVDVEASAVTELSVQSASGAYALRKDEGRWRMAAPVDDQADTEAASAILSKISGLRADRVVGDEPSAEQLAAWGLEPAASTISLTAQGREQLLEIRVGHALGDRPEELYVTRADEPAVYAVRKSEFDEIWKDPQTLRAKEILAFAPEDVTKARVAWQGASWTIERQDGGWRLSETGAELDQTKVEEWLWKVREFKLTRFLEDAPQDLQRYGLADAPGAIRIWTKERTDAKEVLIGQELDEGRSRYARLSERRGAVAELPEGIELILNTSPESFQPATEASTSATPSK